MTANDGNGSDLALKGRYMHWNIQSPAVKLSEKEYGGLPGLHVSGKKGHH